MTDNKKMQENLDRILVQLTPEIEAKCAELQEARKERLYGEIFAFICAFLLIVPATLVAMDFDLTICIYPVIFMIIAVILLSPILFKQQGGNNYEETRTNHI